MNGLLLFKVVAAPLLIGIATLVSRRWGATLGGWFAGLPLTSGPVSVFFALEFGPSFARQAAEGTILGILPVAVFAVTYARVSLTRGPAASGAAALASYVGVAVFASFLHTGVWVNGALITMIVATGLLVIGRSPVAPQATGAPRWDLPVRMVLAAAMVLLLLELGRVGGARLAGILSPFPVFAGIMGISSHITGGPAAAHRLMKGVIVASLAFAAFFIVITVVITRVPLAFAFAAATGAALAVNAFSLRGMVLDHARQPRS